MDDIVALAAARGWPEEDAVREVERQRVESGHLLHVTCGAIPDYADHVPRYLDGH